MKLSERKRNAIYGAIHEAVMRARIDTKLPANQDYRIARIVRDAFDRVLRALNVEENPDG